MGTRHRLSGLLFVLLVLAILFQTGQLLPGILRDLTAVRANVGQHGLWRSAFFHQSLEFANMAGFLNSALPLDSRVVLLPASGSSRPLGNTPAMQFFLAPREVINCLDADCVRSLNPHKTVVVFTQPAQLAWLPPNSNMQNFEQEWGIASLDADMPLSGAPWPLFPNLPSIAAAALWPLLWLLVLSFFAGLTVRACLPDAGWTLSAALGFGLGTGLFTWIVALLWLVGLPLGTASLWFGTLGVVVSGAVAWFLDRRRPQAHRQPRPRRRADLWLVLILLVAGLTVILALGKGFSASDEVVLWGAKARGLAATGELDEITAWGTNTTAYPLHLPIALASLELGFGTQLPSAKLLPPFYALAFGLLVYSFLRRWGGSPQYAGAATLLLLSAALWFRHTALAYANLPLAYALAAAVLLLADQLKPEGVRVAGSSMLLSGLFFAAAAWTRPEGIFLSAAGMIVIVLVLLRHAGSRERLLRFPLAALIAPLLAYAAFWLWLNQLVYHGRVQAGHPLQTAWAALASGSLRLDSALYLLRAFFTRLIDPGIWGLWGIVLTGLLVLGMFTARCNLRFRALALSGAVGVSIILGIYYLAAFDPQHDISWWVSTGLDRMLMPPFLLLFLAGATALIELARENPDRAAAVLPPNAAGQSGRAAP